MATSASPEWSDQKTAQLRQLWDEGLSTAEIGRRLNISKNAVVGKTRRLHLPPRPSPIKRSPDGSRLAQSPTNPDRRTALTLTDFDDSLATVEVMLTDEVSPDEIWARPWAAAKAVVAILALLALYLGLAAASSHRPAADTVNRTAALSLRASGGLLASWGAPVIGGKSR